MYRWAIIQRTGAHLGAKLSAAVHRPHFIGVHTLSIKRKNNVGSTNNNNNR